MLIHNSDLWAMRDIICICPVSSYIISENPLYNSIHALLCPVPFMHRKVLCRTCTLLSRWAVLDRLKRPPISGGTVIDKKQQPIDSLLVALCRRAGTGWNPRVNSIKLSRQETPNSVGSGRINSTKIYSRTMAWNVWIPQTGWISLKIF